MDKYPGSIKQKVEEQINLWQEILFISQQKVELVKGSQLDLDIDELNRLLGEHQERIEAIDRLTREIDTEVRELKDTRGVKVDSTADPEYQAAVAKIRKIALLIQENDSITESGVQEVLQHTQGKLQSLRINKKAQQAYLQDGINNEGWFIDQKK